MESPIHIGLPTNAKLGLSEHLFHLIESSLLKKENITQPKFSKDKTDLYNAKETDL